MKRLIIFTLLILFATRTFAPNQESVAIFYTPPVEPFTKLIYAVGMVEGKCDTTAYNEFEEAAGFFQIRPIRLEDYKMRTGISYTTEDMFDYEKAEEVFLYYAQRIGPYDFEKIARDWNGSGAKTTEYWNRVKKFL